MVRLMIGQAIYQVQLFSPCSCVYQTCYFSSPCIQGTYYREIEHAVISLRTAANQLSLLPSVLSAFDVVFLQDEFSHLVQEWNSQRINALSRAFTHMLYPLLEKELKLKLLQEAKNFVVKVRLLITQTDIKQVKQNLTTPIPTTVWRVSVVVLVIGCEAHPNRKPDQNLRSGKSGLFKILFWLLKSGMSVSILWDKNQRNISFHFKQMFFKACEVPFFQLGSFNTFFMYHNSRAAAD